PGRRRDRAADPAAAWEQAAHSHGLLAFVFAWLGSGFRGWYSRPLPARGARHLRLLRHVFLAGAGARSSQQLSRLGQQMRRRYQRLAQSRSGLPITVMKTLLSVITLLTLFSAAASGATLFLGAYPDSIIVFDEARGQIVDRIHLSTGLPTSMRLSQD